MNRRNGGQGLVEYALILVLVAVVVIVVLTLLGATVTNVFQRITHLLTDAPEFTPIAANGKGKDPDEIVPIEAFLEAARDQDEGIAEAQFTLHEGGIKATELLGWYSDEFVIIQDAFEEAEYQQVIEAMLSLATELAEVDSRTQIKILLRVLPHILDAYFVLDVEVSEELRDRAIEAADQLGKDDLASELDDLWSIVNRRNLEIRIARPGLAEGVCLGIGVLLEDNPEKYGKLVQKVQDQIPSCDNVTFSNLGLYTSAAIPR